jgi:hypothetical protein
MVFSLSMTTVASAKAGPAMGKTQGALISRAGFDKGTRKCLAQRHDAG